MPYTTDAGLKTRRFAQGQDGQPPILHVALLEHLDPRGHGLARL
jgi:hypothetical protein